jgi:hypothetical protein
MVNMANDIFDITCVMLGESEKAIKYNDGRIDFWVPKSMIARGDIQVENNETGTITLTAPTWWLRDKGLI